MFKSKNKCHLASIRAPLVQTFWPITPEAQCGFRKPSLRFQKPKRGAPLRGFSESGSEAEGLVKSNGYRENQMCMNEYITSEESGGFPQPENSPKTGVRASAQIPSSASSNDLLELWEISTYAKYLLETLKIQKTYGYQTSRISRSSGCG